MTEKDRGEIKPIHIVSCAFCTAVMAILCTAAGFIMAAIPGLPLGFCPAVPIMVPFALWFGGWGVIAAYVGCAIGGVAKGIPVAITLPWVINDIFMAGVPLVAFRYLKANPELKTKRDWLIFVVFGMTVNSFFACTWGTIIPVYFGVWPAKAVPVIWAQYIVMSLILIGVITPPILKALTKRAKKTGAYTEGIFA